MTRTKRSSMASEPEISTGTSKRSAMPKLPCCEHGYMAGPDLPDVECCICSRSFCDLVLANGGDEIRDHLFMESERSAWCLAHPEPNPFEVPW